MKTAFTEDFVLKLSCNLLPRKLSFYFHDNLTHVSKYITSFMNVLFPIIASSMEIGFRQSCRGSRRDSGEAAEASMEV